MHVLFKFLVFLNVNHRYLLHDIIKRNTFFFGGGVAGEILIFQVESFDRYFKRYISI